jgi:DNA-binding transcriptional regulator GbsR (MarR family)
MNKERVMQEPVQHFVEQMALICEEDGMPRGAGRILGLLLAEDGPFSLDELAERLQMSKASVSTNARMLEQHGMIRRVGALGDRRDFYRAEQDPWESMLQTAQDKWRRMARVFAEAAEQLPAGNDNGRRRLREAGRFHQLLLEASRQLVETWRERRDGDAARVTNDERMAG